MLPMNGYVGPRVSNDLHQLQMKPDPDMSSAIASVVALSAVVPDLFGLFRAIAHMIEIKTPAANYRTRSSR
jgi:hypothetical protein